MTQIEDTSGGCHVLVATLSPPFLWPFQTVSIKRNLENINYKKIYTVLKTIFIKENGQYCNLNNCLIPFSESSSHTTLEKFYLLLSFHVLDIKFEVIISNITSLGQLSQSTNQNHKSHKSHQSKHVNSFNKL